MKATLIYGAGDVRVEEVPDPKVENPTDAVVRITHSCICGSDLWPYKNREATEQGGRIGHEFIGVVEETGSDVSRVKRGDLVVAPFFYADGTCEYCRAGPDQRVPERQRLGRRDRRGAGRGGPRAVRRPRAHHARRPAGLRAHAEPADALRRLRHRPPRRGDRGRRSGQGRRRRGRRRRGPPRRAGELAARRRADRAHGPPRGRAPTSAGSSAPPTSSPSAARRASRRSATSSGPTARTAPSRPSGSTSRSRRRST